MKKVYLVKRSYTNNSDYYRLLKHKTYGDYDSFDNRFYAYEFDNIDLTINKLKKFNEIYNSENDLAKFKFSIIEEIVLD